MATTVWSVYYSVAASLVVVGKCVVLLQPYRWVWTVVTSCWYNCRMVGWEGKGLVKRP